MERAMIALGEVKLAGNADTMTFDGYGAVFGNLDSYGDVIQPGAFAETLAASRRTGRWPAMLAQHGGMGLSAGDMMPIGVWTDMAEDGKGLWVQGKLAETERGKEAYALMKMEPRPALDGLSIGYVAKKWTAGAKPNEPRRKLEAIELMEISLVTMPANPKARVSGVKSNAGLTERDAERVLRDAGFSRKEAAAIVAAGFKALPQRDADEAGDELAAFKRLLTTLSR